MRVLTEGRPISVIVRFTIPLLIGNLFQQLYTFMDALVVGRTLGKDALAAVGATSSINFLILGFAQGITSGLAILTAQAYGAGEPRKVKQSFATSIVASIALATLITGLAMTVARPLLVMMQTPTAILDESVAFITMLFAGTIAAMAFNLLANMMRAIGDSRTPLFFLIIAAITNVGLEYFFILGLHLGVGGAGLATVIAQFFSAALCWIYIRKHYAMLRVGWKDLKIDWPEIFRHLKVGLPMGFSNSIIAIGAVVLQVMLNTLGTNAIAAYTAAGRIDQLAVMPAQSFGLGMATYAAQNYGAKAFVRLRKGVHQTLVLNVAVSLVLGIIILLTGRPLVNLFLGNQQPAVTALALRYFDFNASMYWMLAILFTLRSFIQGLGNALVPTIAGFFELIMRMLAGVLLIPLFGFAGAAAANPLAWTGSVVVLLFSYVKVMRMVKKKAQEEVATGRVVLTEEHY